MDYSIDAHATEDEITTAISFNTQNSSTPQRPDRRY